MCGQFPTNRKEPVSLKPNVGLPGLMPGQFELTVALTIALAIVLTGTPAQAQNEIEGVLEEITVTAQRREERLQDVPISISTMTGDDLRTIFESGEDIRALAGRVPGLNAESSNGRVAPRFYLRGLGNTDFDLAASQPVLIVMDEVVQDNVILKSFPIFDQERVEVLRGPQGTLFGRNTPAGIIKFDSVKPSEALDGYVQATVGDAGTFNFEGALGGALNADGTLLGRLSVFTLNRDDWIDNSFTGENDALGENRDFAVRGQLTMIGAAVRAHLKVHYRDYEGTSEIFRANVLTKGSDELNENFDRDVVAFNEGDNNPQEAQAAGGSLRLDWDLSEALTLTSITAVETAEDKSLGDIDGGNPDGPGFILFQTSTQDGIEDLTQFTQELRLSSDASPNLFWQAGLFFFNDEFDVFTDVFVDPRTVRKQESEAYALFGQFSYDLSDRWNLTAGLRYTDDKREFTPVQTPAITVDPLSISDEEISWDLSLAFAPTDELNYYARVASGFRGPSIQARDLTFGGPPSVANSETITSAELGFKSTLGGNRFRINGAVFAYQVDDQQITAVGGATNTVQLVNADRVNAFGIDLDIDALFTENFLAQLAIGYNDTEIDDPNLLIATCGAVLADFSQACTPTDPLVTNDDGPDFAVVDGNPLPNAPEFNANLRLRWTIPLAAGDFYVATDWMFQSDRQFLIYDTVEYNSGDTYEGGVRIGFEAANGRWDAAVFGRNITDEEYLKGVIDFNNNTGFVNDRRIWGVTGRLFFDN